MCADNCENKKIMKLIFQNFFNFYILRVSNYIKNV